MTLIHHWSHPSTPAGAGWDIVQTGVVSLISEKGFSSRAALGEAEVIRVVVDDPTGTAEYETLHRWYMVEDETPGDLLVWNGYISDQQEDAGEEGDYVYPSSTGRRWELEITQENTLLGFRAIRTGGDRPAESPGERLLWLLNSDYLKTVYDHGLIDWSSLNAYADMTPSNYTDQTAADVLRSISHWTGYNHYIRYRDASSDIELAFYNPNINTTLDLSSLKISADSADLAFNADGSANFASNLVWPPSFPTTRLHRKGDRVAAGILVRAANNISSYGYRLATSYEFGFRDLVVTDNTVTTQAGADRLRDRLLEQHSRQDERIYTRIQVPAANLNSVMHGQLIEAKFPRLTDWTSYRQCRVVSKSFGRPDNETQAVYDVDLELSPTLPLVPASGQMFYGNSGSSIGPAVPIIWEQGGDTGGTCGPVAKIGPIEYGPITTHVDPGTGSLITGYNGWTINGQGTITCRHFGTISGVPSTNVHTIRRFMNGVQIGTEVVSDPDRDFDYTFTADCPLSTGNRLTMTIEHIHPGGFSGIPAGTGGCGESLHITSASLLVP